MEELIILEWQLINRLIDSIPFEIESMTIKLPDGDKIVIMEGIEESR
ncbi:MAG: hypothetical protein AAFQ94_28015 [Bacteroidota bacterium]